MVVRYKSANGKDIQAALCKPENRYRSKGNHDGLVYLLSFLNLGHIKATMEQRHHNGVADIDAFVDLIRRVQTPHYEEAKRRFANQNVMDDYPDSN